MIENTDLSVLVEPTLTWYEANKRDLPWRKDKDPYHIWVSEIMLQQTRVEAVIPYYERFMTALPTIEALAKCQEDPLLKLWEGLGYYNRVRNMQKAAQTICAEYGGQMQQTYDLQVSGYYSQLQRFPASDPIQRGQSLPSPLMSGCRRWMATYSVSYRASVRMTATF